MLAPVVQRPQMPRCTPPSQEDSDLADGIVERNRSEAEQYLEVVRSQLSPAVVERTMERDVFIIDALAVTSPVRIECVRVPAGELLTASDLAKDREASKSERPQHRVYLAEFYFPAGEGRQDFSTLLTQAGVSRLLAEWFVWRGIIDRATSPPRTAPRPDLTVETTRVIFPNIVRKYNE